MQTTSAIWKSLWASGTAVLEAVAEIDDTTYTDLPVAPVVNRALMQGGLSVGNAVSASCALSVRTGDRLPRAAGVVLKVRLTDGTTTSEWLSMGTFYISRRSVDPVTGIISLECYDALLKANAMWEPAEGDLPMSMADAADALADLLGVEQDSRNDIATGAAYVIDSLSEGETIRDTLARIAVANGGNWIITPANKLRLVPLLDAADAASATSDALAATGVTGGISVHPASAVTGIRYGGEEGAILGDDTGTVVDIGDNAAFLQVLYDRLVGLTFRPFDLSGAVYDPAAELGDYVRAGANGEVSSVLHSEVAAYGPGFTGGLSAPQGDELADEYPYIGGAANKALLAARAYARQVTDALDGALTQQEVFDRLTGHGAAQGLFLTQDGKLYINADYINSGKVRAAYIDTDNLHVLAANIDGTLVIGQLPNTVAEISDIPTNVSELNNDSGYQDATQVTTITEDTLRTTNVVAQNLHVKGANIDDTLTANKISGGMLTLGGANNTNGTMQVLDANGNVVGIMTKDGIVINSGSIVSYSADNLRRSTVGVGSIWFSGYLPSVSSSEVIWRSLLSIGCDLGTYAETSTARLSGSGNIEIRPGEGNDVVIRQGNALTQTITKITVNHLGITLTGKVMFSDPATARTNLAITPENIGAFGTNSITGTLTDADDNTLYGVRFLSGASCSNLPDTSSNFELVCMGNLQIAVQYNAGNASVLWKRYFVNNRWYAWARIESTITGVKGEAESSYRTGNVNITRANLGAAQRITLSGNSWSTLKDVLDGLDVGRTATFYSTGGTDGATYTLTGGKVNARLQGTVYKDSDGMYSFFGATAGGSSAVYTYNWRVSAVTTTGATIGAVYRFTGTAI